MDDNAPNRKILAEMVIQLAHESGPGRRWRQRSKSDGELRAGRATRSPSYCWTFKCRELMDFDVMEKIRENPSLAGSVILMLSADRHLMDATRCRELGDRTYSLLNPSAQSELLDAILSALGVQSVEERLIESVAPVRDKPKGLPLKILLAEDNPVNQKLAVRLLEKAGHHVALAGTGTEALALWEKAGPSRV